jgi:Rab GDP dissociation inhibitor
MAVCKVPANDMEALKSNLMGMFEKKRLINLYKFIENVNTDDQSTWKGMDLNVQPMQDVFKHYNLDENTIDFLGHAVALEFSDAYLYEPAMETI